MNHLSEKVSYLRGLAEGLKIGEETKEGKILVKIIEILDDMALAVSELDVKLAELDDYVESIDEDLADVEEQIYVDDEDEEDDEENDYSYIEVECPHCHEVVYFDQKLFEDEEEIVCPNCHELIYGDEDHGDGNTNRIDVGE